MAHASPCTSARSSRRRPHDGSPRGARQGDPRRRRRGRHPRAALRDPAGRGLPGRARRKCRRGACVPAAPAARAGAARHLDARHRRRDAAARMGSGAAPDDAGGDDVGSWHDRDRRRGDAHRRLRFPGKADRPVEAAVDDRPRIQVPPRRTSRGASRFPRWGPAPRYARLERVARELLAARRPILALGEPGTGHEVVARALELSGAPFVALPNGARLANNPLLLLEEAREGVLYCAEIGQYSRAEQKGLAFLLPKLDKHHIVLRGDIQRAAREPRRRRALRRGAAGAAVRGRGRASAAARATRGHSDADRAVLARRRGR